MGPDTPVLGRDDDADAHGEDKPVERTVERDLGPAESEGGPHSVAGDIVTKYTTGLGDDDNSVAHRDNEAIERPIERNGEGCGDGLIRNLLCGLLETVTAT
ncbi:hypothetical protein [Streptomyces venezuelae]|uniref:hypothetical protein n=1 Tax=Streptomyces venezuelae TaxID=54571 RepID=UPI00123BAE25|nr:hypothetical protein [Streptomyces venezuelae]